MIDVLIFLLFLSPTVQYRVELGIFSFAIMEPVVLLVSTALFTSLLQKKKKRLMIPKDFTVLLLAGMVFWALIVRPWASNWQNGLSDVRDWLIPFVSFTILVSSVRSGWRKWIGLLLVVAIGNAFVGIYQHFADTFRPFIAPLAAYKTGFSLSPEGLQLMAASYAVGFFSHPNGFAMYLFISVLCAIAWPVKGRYWIPKRLLKLVALLTLSAALFWTYAKASLLAMILCLAGFLIIRLVRNWRQFLFFYGGTLLAIGVVAWLALQRVPPAYLNTLLWRFQLWQSAVETIVDHPVILMIGNGMEEFGARSIYPQPHNLYLYSLLTYGLPGLGIVLGIFWYLWKRGHMAFRCRLFHRVPLLAALWIGLISYFIVGLVESNLMGIEMRMIFFIYCACFSGLWREITAEPERRTVADAKRAITCPVHI